MVDVKRVLVIGAGTMGAGIAEVCAKSGMETTLSDVTVDFVDRGVAKIEFSLAKAVEKGKLADAEAKAARARVRTSTDYSASAEADLIIEAVPEDMALKRMIFGKLSSLTTRAIFGSNTSSLSLTELAAALPPSLQSKMIGLHFFNPPPIMPLLEIVRAEQTSEETLATATAFAKAIGKTAIVVRDVPGFATSRLGIILGMEAIRMLESGVASAEDIDRAMELGYKHPMGPLKLTDLVGLDVRLAIAEHLTKEIGPQFAPPPLLRRLVRAGKLGKKTGEGFYRWEGDTALAK